MDLFGWFFIVAGITALASRRFGWVQSGRKVPVLRTLLVPFKLLEVSWIGGGLNRVLKLTGWIFLVLGGLLVVFSRSAGEGSFRP